ncbi:MAG: CbiX/SirB N-terminal domain-containing protein [Rhodocyclaceae bacterium]|nr:CbiX/SirB N-terminal domain-containing protein [Rhodocyclaceae bacterium]
MTEAIVLFAHGARDPEWAGPVRRLAALLESRAPAVRARPAFLEFMTPDLDAAVDELVAEGVRRILVVPVFLAQGGHLKRDVPQQVAAAARRHPDCSLILAKAVGEDDRVLAAMGEFALTELAAGDG